MKTLSTAVVVAASLVMPRVAVSQASALTLEQALARARERAPAIVVARVRIEEARGRLAGASALFRDNPVLESAVGSRRSAGGDSSVDREVGLMQNFELGGRRAARITEAQAGVAKETASAADALRRHLRDVAAAFVRTLAAEERLRLAQSAERVSEEFARMAERRYRAGDIPVLDMNVATSAVARIRAGVHAARAARVGAAGKLRAALGMDPTEILDTRQEYLDRLLDVALAGVEVETRAGVLQ